MGKKSKLYSQQHTDIDASSRRKQIFRSSWAKRFAILLLLVIVVGVYAATRAVTPSTSLVSGFETPIVKDTNYGVPADSAALFVDAGPLGNDSNTGTQSKPLKTVTKAVQIAQNKTLTPTDGKIIVLRGGVYREPPISIYRKLTIQAYPHEQVWFKGSLPVTDWVQSGAIWTKSNWTYSLCQTCTDTRTLDPAYPLAGNPEMVFVNGSPIKQVDAASKVVAGTFYYDVAAKKLYLGTSPVNATVEVTAYNSALQLNYVDASNNPNGSSIRGLGFMHYGSAQDPSKGLPAAVVGNAGNLTFEDNTFAWNATRGLVGYNGKQTMLNNTFLYNGMNGVDLYKADNSLVKGNRIAYSNQEHFSVLDGVASQVAGTKITNTKTLSISDNIIEDNGGAGIWCDLSCYDTQIVRNITRRNTRQGIFYEVSAKAIIASNIVDQNYGVGIQVGGSNAIKVFNNTMNKNNRNLFVYEDERINTVAAETALGISWNTNTVEVKNNILSNTSPESAAFVMTQDNNNPDVLSAGDMIAKMNYNAYYRKQAATPTQISWSLKGSANRDYSTVAAFKSATGYEANGLSVDNNATNPFFADEATTGFTLKSGSIAEKSGEPLPSDVATAIGVSSGVAVDRGALLWPGKQQVVTPTPPPNPTPPPTPPVTTDTTKPIISVSAPAQNATVSGSVNIIGSASDNKALASVVYQIDGGTKIAVTGLASWSVALDTTTVANGTHTIVFTATDTSQNSATASLPLNISNASVDTSPPVGPTSFSRLNLTYNWWQFQGCSWVTNCYITLAWPAATDNVGVTGYEVIRTSDSEKKTIPLAANATTYADTLVNTGKTYTYQVRAKDASGRVSTGFTKTVTVGCLFGILACDLQ